MKKASSKARRAARRPPDRGAVREEMRAEYDFSGGVRGKYAARFAAGRTVRVVVLAPDVAKRSGARGRSTPRFAELSRTASAAVARDAAHAAQPNVRWSCQAISGSGFAAMVILRLQLNSGR